MFGEEGASEVAKYAALNKIENVGFKNNLASGVVSHIFRFNR